MEFPMLELSSIPKGYCALTLNHKFYFDLSSSGSSSAAKISIPAIRQASPRKAADRIKKKSDEGEKSAYNSIVRLHF